MGLGRRSDGRGGAAMPWVVMWVDGGSYGRGGSGEQGEVDLGIMSSMRKYLYSRNYEIIFILCLFVCFQVCLSMIY